MLKTAQKTAGLKRQLDEHLKLAESPEKIWHGAEDVFAELEAHNSR